MVHHAHTHPSAPFVVRRTALLDAEDTEIAGGDDEVVLEPSWMRLDTTLSWLKPFDKLEAVLKPQWLLWIPLQLLRRVVLAGMFVFNLGPYIMV